MLETGSVVDGKYKILNVIGRGGMSVVYLAMNERVNKQWAIKEIVKNDYQKFELDKKEIELMKRIKHTHLPNIVDVIEKENSLLIVMDYIEGQSLDVIFSEHGAQPVEKVLDWAMQLCDVLHYLHTLMPPIIYRDMKPGNVMLKPDGSLMLIDFGAAREYNPRGLKDTISLGTRGYAAPEQYSEGEQSDARTDIYCLGVMLFQFLTGKNPQELCPITEIKPELPKGLEKVVSKCTQARKENRYQSAAELTYALKHYWEYEETYLIAQKKKFTSFLIPVLISLICIAGAIVFGFLEFRVKNHTYEAYLLRAENSVNKEEEIENYKAAICLAPELETGYMELLKNCFLDDNLLTVEESGQLRQILNEYGNGKETNFLLFSRNSEGYAKFAYEAGVTYFYKYEEECNKKNAKSFFEIAANAEILEPAKRERAKRLYVISEYYYRIGMIDEAGDASITYKDYWNDLKTLTNGNIVEADNERTALVMYGEVTAQIISRAMEFCKAGVTKEEMQEQLLSIEKHLKTDFCKISGENKIVIEKEIEELLLNLERAKKIVRSAGAFKGEENT